MKLSKQLKEAKFQYVIKVFIARFWLYLFIFQVNNGKLIYVLSLVELDM